MKHIFVVEGKTFIVDIQQKIYNGEVKYVFIINKDCTSNGVNTDLANISKSTDLFAASSEENIPEYWNSESECLNWAHNWVDRNHQRL